MLSEGSIVPESPRVAAEGGAALPAAPVVSVVIPVYNVEAWLPRVLASVQAQTFADWECVCVDDGSTDGSAALIRSAAAQDARIRLISQPNGGAAAARNRGMAEARGEFLLLLDADDLVQPGLMATCVEQMRQEGSDICAYEGRAVDAEDKVIEGLRWEVPVPEGARTHGFAPSEMADEVFCAVPVCPWNKMYRVSYLREHGLAFPENIRRSEDTPFGVMCLALARRISCVKETFYLYRQSRPGSQTQSVSNPQDYYCYIEAAQAIWQNLRGRGLLPLYGVGALVVILYNASYYVGFLRPQWRMLVARHRLRTFVKAALAEMHALGAESPAEKQKFIHGLLRAFSSNCRRAWRRHLFSVFRR